ncbi:hypothetical protein [Companilactobacillus sp. HBUAS56275]|uniref:Surface layer protein A domain-containing protein n=1 Tax=Candidatus Companilactobacillus pullicola TaxID=2838523 RepID=A0A9D1ZLT7_9LACO|nr:hypothetical protein [Candidatus Companilactobacillus pullicola]
MKLKRLLVYVAALSFAAIGAVSVSQNDADAAVTKVATTNSGNVVRLYRLDGSLITNRALGPDTNWLVDRIFTHNNETFYQVATNEYLKASDSKRLYDKSNPDSSYTPNIQRINYYFIQYLNALHRANGTPEVSTSSDMFEYANHRAYQQVGNTLNHTTAERETAENLYSIGYSFILKLGKWAGINSDRDVAYYLIKGWYDDDNNASFGPGQVGHFGHRAALIYAGSPAALGMSDNATSLNSEWDPNQYSEFNSIYYYTGTNPNTKFISKDAVK